MASIDFAELVAPTKMTRFSNLRPAQQKALDVYAATANAESDIAIELPTGAGKTLIALLVLEYWRKQGKKVAILTGNKTLARQLEVEAHHLGTPSVKFEGRGGDFAAKDLREYGRAKAIGIMNYWVYINQNPSVEPADYLVLDDGQLAEGALVSLYSLRISRWDHKDLFHEAMGLIAQYSDSQVAEDYVKKIDQGPWAPTDLIPFTSQYEMWEEFEALVDQKLGSSSMDNANWKDLNFRWGRLRPKGRQALLFIGADEIVLRPYVFPAQDYEHLSTPVQRIYMSATLHDPEDLRRRIGTPAIKKLEIPSSITKEEDGRRLFVFNQTTSSTTKAEPTEEALVPLRELLEEQKKSVWLCSSKREVVKWKKWLVDKIGSGALTLELTPTGDELEDFCNKNEGHLFIAGRFEGMDFPGETCRLAVFPSLPIATGALEHFTTEQLKDAQFQRIRMHERIKQGIGRCTRGEDDYAIYYLLDTRFTSEMESKPFGTLISERSRKQIELGLELTQDGMGIVVPFARPFLAGDFSDFDIRESKAQPPAILGGAVPTLSASVSGEVIGWRALFETRDLARSASQFEQVCDMLSDAEREHRAFWTYLQAFAEFLSFKMDDDNEALNRCILLLKKTVEEGGSASWFNRLRKAYNKLAKEEIQAVPQQGALLDRWDDLAERYPHHKGRFMKWNARLKEYLDGTHNQVCEALETLGGILGFNASRPSGDGKPDGLWIARDHMITLEAKVDIIRDSVCLADVNQADGHRRSIRSGYQFDDEHIGSLVVIGVDKIDEIAEDALGDVRVLRLDVVEELQSRLEVIMRKYWKGWTRGEADKRRGLREAAERVLPPPGWLLRAIQNTKNPFIEPSELFKEWSR